MQREHEVPTTDDSVAVAVFEGAGRVVTFASPAFRRWLQGGLQVGMPAAHALRRVDGRRFQAVLDQVWTAAAPVRCADSVRGLLGPAAGGADEVTAFALSWSPIPDDAGALQAVLFVAVEQPEGVRAVSEQVDARQATRENLLLRLATAAMRVSSSRDKLAAIAGAAVPVLADVCAVNVLDQPIPAGRVPERPIRTLRTASPSSVGMVGPVVGQRSVWHNGDPASAAVAAGETVVVHYDPDRPPEWADDAGVGEAIRTGRVHCTAMVPVVVDGTVHAVIAFGAGPGRAAYRDEHRELFRLIAAQAGVAVQQGERYDHLREASLTLQRAMLSPPPPTPGIDIQVRYRPAGEGIEVGGDWYDVFHPADGDLAVVVGDVAGHDINAAAVMGQLRSIVRAFAVHSGPAPHDVLTHVDQVMLRMRLTAFATALYVRVRQSEDGAAGLDMTWSNAGHPAPILVSAEGVATALDQARHPVLGAVTGVVRSSSRVTVPPGATVLLFSDGLFERRHRVLDDCFDDVVQQASRMAEVPLGELCDALMRSAPHDDDVVLVALRNTVVDHRGPGDATS